METWPIVDCLMSWYSFGFPLAKAREYARLRRPFCVNDLSFEPILRDRRLFYDVLRRNGIPCPRHAIANREGAVESWTVVNESEDAIEVGGVKILKPFVEKPVDAEDHNIHIYYPRRLGGGSKRLFRKVRVAGGRLPAPAHGRARERGARSEERPSALCVSV